MKAYIDTSVILSSYKPDETSYNACLRLARLDELVKVGSYILLVELFSTISRLYNASKIRLPASTEKILSRLALEERVYAIVNAIILDWNLTIPNLGLETKHLKLENLSLLAPEAIVEACRIAPKLNLKTLDLLHLAYAKIISENLHNLEYFVTLDREILNSRDKIKRITGVQPATPQELIGETR